MNKKRIASIAVVAGILAVAVVFAARVVSDISESTVNARNLKIKVVMSEENGGTEGPVSGETVIIPGAEVSRIARVRNTGAEDAWVRAKANLYVNGDSVLAKDNSYITLKGENTTDWTWREEEGYWYLNEPLKAGATSEVIFTGLKVTEEDLDESFSGANLKVEAEGTQVKNNGSTVFEANGWTSN